MALRHRRIAFHLRPKVEQELRKLEEAGIIERVEGSTIWVSPIVVTRKPKQPGEVRICIDMRLPNSAIKRERHLTPTVDDIICELSGAGWFSKMDLRAGYHQLQLHPDSRYITTFSTHVVPRRYKRLKFGISSAAEVFQNAVREVLAGLSGVLNVSDDILVYAKSAEEHHRRLTAVLKRLKEAGLTLHKEKCEFLKRQVSFFGYVFSEAGVNPDPEKVKDVKDAPAPTTVSEVRSFLGMVNYCGRFIPNLTTITQPLRELTKNKTTWEWGPTQEDAFQVTKTALSADTTLVYFNPLHATVLAVDANPTGLGAVLSQQQADGEWAPVAYASRALTDTEQRYSQIEREVIAIHWGCRHFHLYVYGHPLVVHTDHKPLIPLFEGSASKPPPRIEKWILQLQEYSYTVVYKPGALNPADYLSRHPRAATTKEMKEAEETEEYVRYVVERSRPLPLAMEEIQKSVQADDCLQLATQANQLGRWEDIKKQ